MSIIFNKLRTPRLIYSCGCRHKQIGNWKNRLYFVAPGMAANNKTDRNNWKLDKNLHAAAVVNRKLF